MENFLSGPVNTLISVILGAALVHWFTNRRADRDHQRKINGLGAALHGEILASRNTAIKYQYRETVLKHLENLKAKANNTMPQYTFTNEPQKSVYYTNLSQIGHFPAPLPEKLAMLYSHYDTVVIDLQDMDKGKWDTNTREEKIACLEMFLDNYDTTVALAGDTLALLEKYTKS